MSAMYGKSGGIQPTSRTSVGNYHLDPLTRPRLRPNARTAHAQVSEIIEVRDHGEDEWSTAGFFCRSPWGSRQWRNWLVRFRYIQLCKENCNHPRRRACPSTDKIRDGLTRTVASSPRRCRQPPHRKTLWHAARAQGQRSKITGKWFLRIGSIQRSPQMRQHVLAT